jgi:putative addiction module component (TIGR02574 family)
MEVVTLKKIIEKSLDTNDKHLLEQLVEVIENYNRNPNEIRLSEEQLKELDRRRKEYLSGKSETFSWEEIKQELREKHGLQAADN